jgi:hypothetical protein
MDRKLFEQEMAKLEKQMVDIQNDLIKKLFDAEIKYVKKGFLGNNNMILDFKPGCFKTAQSVVKTFIVGKEISYRIFEPKNRIIVTF